MSVYRIGEMISKPEVVNEMREFLMSIMAVIKASPGCESVQMYQSQADPGKFMMIEVWNSVESHQASVNTISPEDLAQIRPLLNSAPTGAYFDLIEKK
jgi:quinol monooxygenase YgiN